MRIVISRLSTAILVAGALALPFSPITAVSARQVLRSPAASPRALYQQAFQNLRHVTRFQFVETAQIFQAPSKTVHDGFRYLAPDRVATALEVQPIKGKSQGQVVVLESIQVGTTKCQTPPQWVCFHSARPDIVALVRSLLEPKLHSPTYRATQDGKRALRIEVTGQSSGLTYAGTLTLGARDHLPLSFLSAVHRGRQLMVTQNVSFTYGGSFRIELPKGQGVHLPKP